MSSNDDTDTAADTTSIASQLHGLGRDARLRLEKTVRWLSHSYLVLIVIGALIGFQIAPVVSTVVSDPVEGTVAVIPLEGSIGGDNAASVTARLKQAREDPRIDAVVLRVNSGGGGAASSEQIYTAVKRTAAEMPVVVSVNAIAASGAYYSAVPADAIYVKPASFVGSIGVIFLAPQDIPPVDRLVTTGPNKLTGADQREWAYKIESAKRAFVNAVVQNREPNGLRLSRSEISYAKLYTGAEAVDNGLADRIGGLEDAINHAAKRAGVFRFEVKLLGYEETVPYLTQTAYIASSIEDKEVVSPTSLVRNPNATVAPQLLMLPRATVYKALQTYATNASRLPEGAA